jgi:predicted ATPase
LPSQRSEVDELRLVDEPEAALSPQRQLALVVLIDTLVREKESQLVIATHPPILMAQTAKRFCASCSMTPATNSYTSFARIHALA